LINATRAHLAEFGIVAGIGRNGLETLLDLIRKGGRADIPAEACLCLTALVDQIELVKQRILEMDRRILTWRRANDLSWKLEGIPGVGPLIATALAASVPDPTVFRSGRDLSAWIGLVAGQICAIWE
jgi:transposase